MKVSQIRKIMERWAVAQNHAGGKQQAEAIQALSHVLAKADKITVATLVKKLAEAPASKAKN